MESSFSLTSSPKSTWPERCAPASCSLSPRGRRARARVRRNSAGDTGHLREDLKCWIQQLVRKGFRAPFLPYRAASSLHTANEFQGEKKAQFSGPLNLWPLWKIHRPCRRARQAGGWGCIWHPPSRVGDEVQEPFLVVYMLRVLSPTTWGAFKELRDLNKCQTEKGGEIQF